MYPCFLYPYFTIYDTKVCQFIAILGDILMFFFFVPEESIILFVVQFLLSEPRGMSSYFSARNLLPINPAACVNAEDNLNADASSETFKFL